jgi:succinate-semialdehyde dehydrogenase/glutarate-semialdehyde dehydrogenase
MFTSYNPYTQDLLKSYDALSWEQILEKITIADQAYHSWKIVPVEDRIEKIRDIALDLKANVETYGAILTEEMGKLKKEAEAEISKCVLLCDYYADNATDFPRS